MEILIELLIQVLGELFGEILVTLIGKVIASLFNTFKTENQTKRRFKYVLTYGFFGLIFAVLIFSLFTKKGLYVQVILIYLMALSMIYFFKFTNRNLLKSDYQSLIRIFSSILHDALAITLIVLNARAQDSISTTIIIIGSSITLAILFMLDGFRIARYIQLKRGKNEHRKTIN